MITTVIFDMGNVLVHFRWKELFHEMGFEGEKFERLADATVRNPIWNEIDRVPYTDEMMYEAFVKNAPDLEPEIKELMGDRFQGFLKKFDYTDGWLDALKSAGYRICILSNFSKKAFEESRELDYVKKADIAVISYQVRMIKPDPAIYRYLLDTYGIDPKEAVFIDDNADNIAAAEKLGITGILFTDKRSADERLLELGVRY
ncbi:MAG: HAD family phosphatase [Lachnospiraceae bacterium]|nr:HAD family phosphatase [Lachnospiraceae bacterium]